MAPATAPVICWPEHADILVFVQGPGRYRQGAWHETARRKGQGRHPDLHRCQCPACRGTRSTSCCLYYADPQVGGVLGSLVYGGTEKSATAGVGGLYWRIEEALKDAESRTGNVMGADGSIFSVRRALYPAFPDDVLDDLTVSMAVVFAGKRLIKAKDVVAYEALVAQRADEYRRKVRIAARAWHTHGHLRPQLACMATIDRFKYASRKIVRWFGAAWMLVGGVAALALAWRVSPIACIALIAGGILLLMLGLQMRRGPLAALVDLLLAYVATLRGVTLAMRGTDASPGRLPSRGLEASE